MTDTAHSRNPAWKPGAPLPVYADRSTLSQIISHLLFPVSARTLRTWPLLARRPNKRVVYKVDDALGFAEEKLRLAPRYRQSAS